MKAYILLVREEILVLVEMLVSESSLLDQLVLEFAFRLHHEQ